MEVRRSPKDQAEIEARWALQQARSHFEVANPCDKPAARRQLIEAMTNFSRLVLGPPISG
jgi:hypothetical protein